MTGKRKQNTNQTQWFLSPLFAGLKQKCTKIEDLTARVQIMDKQISERKKAQIPLYTSNEKLDIAIYGLNTYNEVTTSVNRLFKDMNLGNTECISAYRTPTRPGMSRPGVVIAEMRCLSDKRAVLERNGIYGTCKCKGI